MQNYFSIVLTVSNTKPEKSGQQKKSFACAKISFQRHLKTYHSRAPISTSNIKKTCKNPF